MRGGKKAQVSMEFLMTYGWALLVVLIAMGALTFYFGTGSTFLANEGCYMQPGFFCEDFRADEGSVMVKVSNSLGRDLAEISFTHPSCTLGSDNPSLKDDQNIFLTVSNCDFGVEGNYIDETFILNYSFLDSSLDHLSDFKIGAIIEGGSSQGMGGGGDLQGGNPGGPGTGYQSDSRTVLLLKFEETEGAFAYDSSSYSNDGAFNGDTFRDAGYFGTGARFDGVGDYIAHGDKDSLDFGLDSFTVELWIKTTEINLDSVFSKKGNKGYALGIVGGAPAFEIKDNSGFARLIAETSINDDSWHHVVFIVNRATDEIVSYVDSVLQITTQSISSIGNIDNSISLKIGKGLSSLDGIVDEVRFSDFVRY